MAKLIGPDFVVLKVKDLEASRPFNPERFGLMVAAYTPPDSAVFNTRLIARATGSAAAGGA